MDNGDGTITDTKTGLMWEKLSDDGSIHDKDTAYTWANAFAVKVATLNGGGGFAGHTDWRVPNVQRAGEPGEPRGVEPGGVAGVQHGLRAGVHGADVLVHAAQPLLVVLYVPGQPDERVVRVLLRRIVNAVNKGNSLYVRAVRGGS